MLKLVYGIDRRADVSEAAFYDHWRGPHASLVTRHAEAIGARRYVQSHTVPTTPSKRMEARGMRPPLAGVATLWWDSLEALQSAQASPQGQAAFAEIAADEATFINASGSLGFLAKEHPIFDYTDEKPVGPDSIKYAYLIARRSDLTVEACHRTWRNDHARLATGYAETVNMAKYIQSHAVLPEINAAMAAARGWDEPADGLTELWLGPPGASRATQEQILAADVDMEVDERRFVDLSRSRSFPTKEYIIFDFTRRG